MKNELNDIDLIIKQKLTSSAFSVPDNEWNMLSRHMSVKNFLRFNAGQVNIFYVGAFVAFMSFSGIFYAQTLKLKREKKKLEQIIELNSFKKPVIAPETEKATIDNNPQINPESSNENKKAYYYSVPDNNKKIVEEKNEEIKEETQDKQQVTDNNSASPNDSIQKATKTKKVIKRKIFVKKEPVIIKDTIIKRGNKK